MYIFKHITYAICDMLIWENISLGTRHCVKSVQIRAFFWSVFSPNTGKYGPKKTI